MTERKVAEQQLRQLALFDRLTGLHNRASLHMELEFMLQIEAGDRIRYLTLAAIDIDRFKDINDTLGHSIGDKLLQEVARRLNPYSAKVGFIAWAKTISFWFLTIAVTRSLPQISLKAF
ncbi:GGDEF domain-containing protein [Bradyrhizobium sp. RT3a]|uniref:GGDEF domain-containing protein n=1 Tax=unclassified Bradyrhizobium TaxID=2631580 RepID=UPI003390EB9E